MKIYFLTLILTIHLSFSIPKNNNLFRNWNCIGIKNKIDFTKPYKINIGELPLVIWQHPKTMKLISGINICKHMGSKLDNGIITSSGLLKCQYHGLEIGEDDKFGEVVEVEGKIFWAYKPLNKKPCLTPFFSNKEYVTSFLEIDMDCSLLDSAYNTMDLRHPEYVHNKIIGFGSKIPPKNIKHFIYKDELRLGLSFDYISNERMKSLNKVKKTKNFHMYIYPTFTWSKVTFENKNLIISVNFLPLSENKTRWYVTICHNYYKDNIGPSIMKFLARAILNQDYFQMQNQYNENILKKEFYKEFRESMIYVSK
jgi:phenylpropionate dioxygenase-like ring-hydroxylating dioxygenase large terminal subunit